ncbi:hypothetical protein GWI33_009529 [Rhynchophorus ferrugineus]|uniref:Uncharacterized protein n=1 Tax=Rhynchophorus ferrugineus TaxID=354439 RepID=A0A834J260_RHYFE|nr:hypothetical protein GWI33_009529 [Rhynchophorus ferrugineus]
MPPSARGINLLSKSGPTRRFPSSVSLVDAATSESDAAVPPPGRPVPVSCCVTRYPHCPDIIVVIRYDTSPPSTLRIPPYPASRPILHPAHPPPAFRYSTAALVYNKPSAYLEESSSSRKARRD